MIAEPSNIAVARDIFSSNVSRKNGLMESVHPVAVVGKVGKKKYVERKQDPAEDFPAIVIPG